MLHGRAKTQHGLSGAIRRGLLAVTIQDYLTAAAMNLKKLAGTLANALKAAMFRPWQFLCARSLRLGFHNFFARFAAA